jgi:hypothetical protein
VFIAVCDCAKAFSGAGVPFMRGMMVALGLGLGPGLTLGLVDGDGPELPARGMRINTAKLRVGLAFGLMGGLAGGLGEPKWASYMLARTQLAMRHRLPWSLMDFLADAHQRGVLRQAGAVYQFRHIDLQRRLAATRPDWHHRPG